MELRGRTFLVLAVGAFGLAIASFLVRVVAGETFAAPFFLTAFGLAALAFLLAVLVKLGVVSLAVPTEGEG